MASAQENAATIRRGYDLFNSGQLQELGQLFAADAVWHAAGRGRLSGDKRGRDATLAYFSQIGELSGGTFRAELHDIVADEAHLVGLHIGTAQREGRTLRVRTTLVFHLRDGQIVEVWEQHDDTQALDEFFA